jgi:hypothetical protein
MLLQRHVEQKHSKARNVLASFLFRNQLVNNCSSLFLFFVRSLRLEAEWGKTG